MARITCDYDFFFSNLFKNIKKAKKLRNANFQFQKGFIRRIQNVRFKFE